jgi:hypothetical protein
MWSQWKELIPTNYESDHDGPAAYELRVRLPMLTDQVVYAGETNTLRRRMREHDRYPNDNIRKQIDQARMMGRIDYHYVVRASKFHAVRTEGVLLGLFYEWNIKGNSSTNPPRDPSLLQKVAEMGLGTGAREQMQRDTKERNKRRRR